MLDKISERTRAFPLRFWVLVLGAFIDNVGRTAVFPFFAMYITRKFGIGLTEAGVLLAIFSICGLAGSMIGGALTDRFGRRGMVLFGIITSALSSLAMGFINQLWIFYPLAVFVGLLSNIGGPARMAMVADLLPEEKRGEGFGTMRVAANLAWVVGPMIGGLVAAHSYRLLFILDCITSLITAGLIYRLIPETRPEPADGHSQEGFLETLAGYRLIARDGVYAAFLAITTLSLIAYRQMYDALAIYLRDVHQVAEKDYGLLVSINAGVVVLFQLWVTRKLRKQAPLLVMALGTFFYLIGLTMYGFVSDFSLFVVAMLVITVGEMFQIPAGQVMVTRFAPGDMRGRYLASYTLVWTISSAVAPSAAGLIMDNANPDWVWYAAGLLSAAAVTGFVLLHLITRRRFAATAEAEQAQVMEDKKPALAAT